MAAKNDIELTIDDRQVQRMLDRVARDAPGLAAKVVADTAESLHESLRDDVLNRAGTGRVYPSRTGEGTHRASAPGEPPAPDTHEYRQSWKERRIDIAGLERAVFTEDERGPWLEYGTVKIQPRPHAMPAAIAHKRFFENQVRAAARKLERGAIL